MRLGLAHVVEACVHRVIVAQSGFGRSLSSINVPRGSLMNVSLEPSSPYGKYCALLARSGKFGDGEDCERRSGGPQAMSGRMVAERKARALGRR